MVNEEMSAKSLHFMVEKGAKPTVRMFINILKAYMRYRHDKKYFGKEKVPTGKMPVKKLIKQGKGAQKIELDGEDIHLFNRLAKKYGVDYAVVKDKEAGTYKIFFKAQDADPLSDLVADYTRRTLGKEKGAKASVLGKLQKFKEIVASIPRKVAEKRKEQTR
ncbi:PcfB family protein [Eubacteriales bacterium KG127]